MRRFFSFLARLRARLTRTVLMVIGVLLIALLIWLVGPLIAVAGRAPLSSRAARGVAILILVLVAALAWALRRRRRTTRNEALVGELSKARAAEPEEDLADEDLKAMNERADKALKLMRTTRVGKEREFIYELPWYLIIGPPGAGKTTALHNAQLKFPVAQELGAESVTGVGGTRTCEWWFTDEAVLIDTAGRYTTQDSHQEVDSKAWLGFLALLSKYRPRQPITGLLVVLSAADLAGGGERDLAAHGRAIRSRINEVAEKLGVRAPVYIVVTKLDLLAGFTEFFDDVGQPERDQVWGHTFDIDVSRTGAVAGEPFTAAFDALLERLNGRLLNRIQGERDMQRRGLIFGFPQQFANLFGPLSTLVQIIGRETKFEPTPLIRGVYFTSATQFGRPIDRVMAAVSAKFGVPAAATGGQAAQGRSYFLRDLLQSVVFGEAALASRDPKTERRRRLIRIGAIVGGASLLILVSIAWTVGYVRSTSMISLLERKASHLQTLVAGLPAGQVSDSDLMAVLPALEEARSLPFATTAPAPFDRPRWTFGLSRTHALRSQVDAAYVNLLNHQMLPRLILDLEDQLRTSAKGAGADTRQQTYGLLRIYLMLGRAPRAPMEKGQIVNWFANEWANRYAGAEDDGARAALQRHLETLVSGRLEPPALDRDIIIAAREQVRSLSPGERAYARMLSDPSLGDLPPFSLTDVSDVAESGLFSRKSGKSLAVGVPGIYRKAAFYGSVVPAIAKIAAQSVNESWVTEDKAVTGALPEAEEVGRIKDQILIAYLKDFTRQWDDFINDITISGQHNAKERIAIAVRPPSPVKLLLSTLAGETNLTPPSLNMRSGGGAVGALRVGALFSRSIYRGVSRATSVQSTFNYGQNAQGPPGPLDEVVAHFKWLWELNPAQGPSPLDAALQALSAVGDASISAQAASGLGDPLLQRSKTSTAMEATARLDQTADALPPVVRAMFTGFVKTTASSLNQSVKQSLQQQYGAQLSGECKSIVAGGFPFSESTHEVSIDDVSRLFRPSGLIDQFVQTNLAGMIDTSRRPWTVSAAGRAVGLQGASVQDFQRADEIKRRLFQPGDVRPNVRFLLEPVEVTSPTGAVTLSIDGQPASFEKTNRKPVEMKWPGPTPAVSLSFPRDKGGPALRTWSGDFALARMLESGKITASSAKSLSFEIGTDADTASFTLRFLNGDNPFVFRDFKAFRCPAGL